MSKDDIWLINDMRRRIKDAVSIREFDLSEIEDLIEIIDKLIKQEVVNERD